MEIYDEDRSFHTDEFAETCTKCSFILPRLRDCATEYFEHGHVTCGKCAERVDLWQSVSGRARTMGWRPRALTAIGAGATSFKMTVKSGHYYKVGLEEKGVPSGARILGVNFTGQGGEDGLITALASHGNCVPRRMLGTVFHFLAIPLGEGLPPRTGTVACQVVWIRQQDSDGWIYLLNAFESFVDGEHAPALVFAQSAVEISLMPIVARRLRKHSSKKSVENFMSGSNSLSFSHALNVLLPNLCGMCDFRMMPSPVIAALDAMRRSRNKIIHEGQTVANITQADTANGLSAAALAVEYMRYIAPKLLA